MKNVSNMTDVDLTLLITASVRKVVNEQACQYVTGKELCRQLQMFTASWLKNYGHLLPRISASVVNEETGKTVSTGWAYNIGKIRQMVDNNELTFIFKPKVEYRASNKH